MDIAGVLKRKKAQLVLKRIMDILISAAALLALWPLFLLIALAIRLDSRGPVFYRQERVTRYGKHFRMSISKAKT